MREADGLRQFWRDDAEAWIRWSRDPGLDDDYWGYHQDHVLALVGQPQPGELVVDLCCGEGRLSRALSAAGHRVIGLDASGPLVAAARTASPQVPVLQADVTTLPLVSACADTAVMFMCLHDLDDPRAAFREARRVLRDGGRLVVAMLHPMTSRRLTGGEHDATFELTVQRRGRTHTYRGAHRDLSWYLEGAWEAGLTPVRRDDPTGPDGSSNFVDIVLERSR